MGDAVDEDADIEAAIAAAEAAEEDASFIEYNSQESDPPPSDDPESDAIIDRIRDLEGTYNPDARAEILEEIKGFLQAPGGEEDPRPYSERFKDAQFSGARAGRGLIHYAAIFDSVELVEYLVSECGFNINLEDNFETTVLHHASQHGAPEMVQFILDNGGGGSINKKDQLFMSPFHYALSNYRYGNATTLVNGGLNISSVEGDDKGIFYYIFLNPPVYRDVDELNQADLAVYNNLLHEYDTFLENVFSNPKICDEINKIDSEGSTPLIQAVINNDLNIAEKIIDAGCPDAINFPDKFGNTPLHYAAKESSSDTLQYVLGVPSVDLNKQNKDGKTPLHLAARRGDVDAVTKLIIKGAKIGIKDNKERTPVESLDHALSRGQVRVIQKEVEDQDKKIKDLGDIPRRIDEWHATVDADYKNHTETTPAQRLEAGERYIKTFVEIERDLHFILNPPEVPMTVQKRDEEIDKKITELKTLFKTANDAVDIRKPYEYPHQRTDYVRQQLDQVRVLAEAFYASAERRREELEVEEEKVNMKAALTILLSVDDRDPPEELEKNIKSVRDAITAEPDDPDDPTRDPTDLDLVNGVIRHAYIEKIKAISKEQRLLALAALRDRGARVGDKRKRTGGTRRQRREKSKATTKKRGRSKTTYKSSKPKAKGRGKRSGKLRTVKRRK